MKKGVYIKEFFALIAWCCFFFAFLFVVNYNGNKKQPAPLKNDHPVIDKNAYIVDGDTLATENI